MAESIVGICVAPRVAKTKNGESYVAFDLSVKGARTPVRIWRSDLAPEAGALVSLRCAVESTYQGQEQWTAEGWEEFEGDRAEYEEHGNMLKGEEILGNIFTALHGFEDPAYWLAVRALRSIEKPKLLAAAAAAARGHHHARPGGLLEHIGSMFECAVFLINHYDYVYANFALDRGVLLAAVVLHDLGKLVEMSGPYASEYTTEGRLIGHIVIGAEMVDRFAPPELSEERKRNLKHCILSHHGKLEWGSPVVPQTPEAILLHQIDMLDSRMDPVLSRAASGEKGWVSMGYGKSAYLGGE